MRDSKGRFSKPAPRAFKVGDKVKGMSNLLTPIVGVIDEIDYLDTGDMRHRVKRESDGCRLWCLSSSLRLLEPAPQPKAEEAKHAALFVICRVCGQRCYTASEHQGHACVGTVGVDARDAEIATLKAEVERLKERLEEGRESFDGMAYELTVAKAKLDDIRAVVRYRQLRDAIPSQLPTADEIIQRVLDGAA